jgi:gluconokinase
MPRNPDAVVVLMRVSGSGRTTVATRLGWQVLKGDTLPLPANVAEMPSGTPLDDADRGPSLHAIAAEIDRWRADDNSGAVARSALERSYRDILIGARPDVVLVYLQGNKQLIARQLALRRNHFMPPALLDS